MIQCRSSERAVRSSANFMAVGRACASAGSWLNALTKEANAPIKGSARKLTVELVAAVHGVELEVAEIEDQVDARPCERHTTDRKADFVELLLGPLAHAVPFGR